MWKLTIEDDEGQRTSLDLSLDEYTIGRAEDASIRLTERNVSRRHALLRQEEGGWVVEDEGSYNGTYVNGERVGEPKDIQTGDVVQLGDYRVEILDAAEEAVALPDPQQQRPDRLVMVIGPTPGMEYPLTGERLTVGRAEEAGVSINHASVSRLHCEVINIGQNRWEVIDQGSSNGIRINGVDLRRGIIQPGDAFELGDVRLRYVARGKYFRPAVDLSQQLPAVIPFDGPPSATTAAPSSATQRSVGTIVAIGAVVGVLILGAFVMLRPAGSTNPSPASTTAPMATSEHEERVLLKRASEEAGTDIEFAHKLLRGIRDDSPLRDTDQFSEIEDAWADHMFKKAEIEQDPKRKQKILNKISSTGSVSAAKRKKAAQMALDVGPAIDLDKGTQPGSGPTKTTTKPTVSAAPLRTATTVATTAPPEPPTTKSAQPKSPPGKFDESSQKRSLRAKMMSGTATENDLRMLRSICSNDGDRGCRNMANAKLKALRKKKESK